MKAIKLYYPFLVILTFSLIALYLFSGNPDSNILMKLRIPRLVLTVFTGLTLAGIGSIYQLMLNNPLAEPYILGISSGSAFLSILFALAGVAVLMPIGGFAGAMITMSIVWYLAQAKGRFDKTRLILSGIISGMFFSAAISLVMYLFHKDTIMILGILMGNLGRIFTLTDWYVFLGLCIFGMAVMYRLFRYSIALDIMTNGDVYAQSVEIDVHRIRRTIFLLTSVLIGISVAYAGIIGFVGLIIPHITRLIFRGQKKIFIMSMWLGAVFLVFCDYLAANLTVLELPAGIITAALGCPFFVFLLLKRSYG